MKKYILAVMVALGLATSSAAQYCPSCIQNSAIAQEAQFNVSSATVRGKLTVGTLVASAFSMGTSTAAVYYGSGTFLTNLNAAQLLFGFVPTGRILGPYTGISGVGTLTTGVWNGDIIGSPYGGTGANLGTSGIGSVPYFSSVGTMSALAPDSAGKLLQTNGSAAPSWTGAPQVLGTNVTAIPMANLLTGQFPMGISVNDASISTVSAAKVIGNIPGNANNIYGFLPLTKLSTGTLINTIVASSITGTGVTPGIYGGPTQLPQLTIGSDGRISLASQSTFTVSASSIGPGPLPPGVTIAASQITAGNLANTVVASSLTATGVTEGSYGLAAQVSTFTVRKDGRLSSAGSVLIAIPPTQITAGTLPGTVLVPAASIQAGSLGPNVLASSLTATGIPAGSYGGSGQLLQITVNAQGRLTSASTISVPTLSTSVALTNADNAFTAPQTFFASATINSDLFVGGFIVGNGAGISNISPASIGTGTLPSYVVASSITVTGVTPGTYGDASHSATLNVRSDGRIQTASAPSIVIAQSGVTGLPTALTAIGASTAAIAASVSCQPSAVGGVLCQGSGNTNGFNYATVSGGLGNSVQNQYATIGGGSSNLAQALYSTVPGGHLNLATGQAGVAMGERAENDWPNSFVWSDGIFYQDHGPQTFNIHATGGSFFDAGPVNASFPIVGASSITGSAFFGDGSHLSGISVAVSTSGLQASLGENVVTVSLSSGQYSTVGAAVAAIGVPTSSTTILINGGTYTESPFTLPNNVNLVASGRLVTLIFNSASPAITITGSSTLEQMAVTNTAGPAIDVVSTSTGVIRFTFLTANGANGYAVRLSSSSPTARFLTATATTGHGLWITGSGGGTYFNSIFTTNGSGNALYQSGNGAGGLYMSSEFRGTTGNAAILLSSATFRVHTAGVCAKAGQPMLDATFNQNGTGFLQEWVDVVVTNLCTGGGGLSRIIGPNVAIFNGQSINGVTIYSTPGNATPPAPGSFMVADSTSSAKWVNSPLFIDVPNSRIGISTAVPAFPFEMRNTPMVLKNNTASQLRLESYSASNALIPTVSGFRAQGTDISSSAVLSGDRLLIVNGRGFDGVSFPGGTTAGINFDASENHTPTAHGAQIGFVVTPNGTTTSSQVMTLSNSGRLGIGTTSPASSFSVSSGTVYEFDVFGSSVVNYSADAFFSPGYQTRVAAGSLSAPTAISDGKVLGFLSATGHDGTGYPTNNLTPVAITFTSSGSYTSSSHGAYQSFLTTPINSTTRTERMRIDDAGNVGIGTTTPSAMLDVQGTVNFKSSATASAFFGDGSHLSGVQPAIGSGIVTVSLSGGQYSTVGAALTAIGVPTSSTTILIDGGSYTESPLTIPNNVHLIGTGRFVTLLFNSASPAITITGNATLEQLSANNSGGPGVEILSPSTSAVRLTFFTTTDASGYGIRVSSAGLQARFVTATITSGHALQITGNSALAVFNSFLTTNGSGNAILHTATSGGGLYMATEIRGTTGNAAVMLASATARFQAVGICAKAGQPMIDASFNQNGGSFLQSMGDVTATNSCTGGGGLSRLIGTNVGIFQNASINGVTIYNAADDGRPLIADSTSTAKWSTTFNFKNAASTITTDSLLVKNSNNQSNLFFQTTGTVNNTYITLANSTGSVDGNAQNFRLVILRGGGDGILGGNVGIGYDNPGEKFIVKIASNVNMGFTINTSTPVLRVQQDNGFNTSLNIQTNSLSIGQQRYPSTRNPRVQIDGGDNPTMLQVRHETSGESIEVDHVTGTGGTALNAVANDEVSGTNLALNPNLGKVVVRRFAPTSGYDFDVLGDSLFQGHVVSSGTAPSVSSCGTGAAVDGSDTAGKVTVGTVPGVTCTLTFNSSYVSKAPACVVTNETTANLIRATSTISGVTFSGTILAGDSLAYICIGAR